MKKQIFTLTCIIISIITNAQIEVHKIDLTSSGALFRNPDFNKLDLKKIEGSPYLYDSFMLAEISGVPQKILVRYNILNDLIEVQFDNKQNYNLTKDEPYTTISPINQTNKIKLLRYINKEGEVYGYLTQIYVSEKLAVYRKDQVKQQKAKEAISTYHEATPAKFVKLNPEYYWNLNNNRISLIPKNRKNLIELFPNTKENIINFIKENKIDFDNEKSIIELSKFIQTIK
jgi:hypothetical protein|nr:hypothetical protein [uncultured Flavobacterium sp.]